MAYQRNPYDPLDPYRSSTSDDDFERATRLERQTQLDPELSEGPAGNGKITLFALAVALLLGAVFYGLNNSSVHQASTAPPPQTTRTDPANPNNRPGMTTGSATDRVTTPQSSPAGSEADRATNPAAGQNNDNR